MHGEAHARIEDLSPAERRLSFRVLYASVLSLGMGMSVIYVVLPPVGREMGLGEFSINALFVLSSAIWVIMGPWWGRRLGRWHRRPALMIGLASNGVTLVLFALVLERAHAGLLPLIVAYPLFMLARVLHSVFGPGGTSAAQAYLAERTSAHERVVALAYLSGSFGLGATIGPGVGALLTQVSLTAPLYFVALLALLGIAGVAFGVRERAHPAATAVVAHLSMRDPRIVMPMAVGVVIGFGQALTVQTAAFFVMDRLGHAGADAAHHVGMALMTTSGAALIAQVLLVPRLKLTPEVLQNVGLAAFAASFVVIAATRTDGMLIAGMVLNGLGSGIARSGNVGLASLSVRLDEQGAIAGLIGAAATLGFVISPFIAIPLYRLDPAVPFAAMAAVMTATLIWSIRRGDRD
ncbi:MAG: MFS transporter [Gammaproteobacteria bacterium]